MTPKTDQELREMGWSGLDVYRETLLAMITSGEPEPIVNLIAIREEINRVEQIMERVG